MKQEKTGTWMNEWWMIMNWIHKWVINMKEIHWDSFVLQRVNKGQIAKQIYGEKVKGWNEGK